MELTPAEEALIKTLREIDRKNPAGVDGFSEEEHIDMFMAIASSAVKEGERRYRLFLKESRRQPIIDLAEAQRPKTRAEEKPQQDLKNFSF